MNVHYTIKIIVFLIFGCIVAHGQNNAYTINDLPDAQSSQGSTGGQYLGPQIYPQGGFRNLAAPMFIKIGFSDPVPCSSIAAGIQKGRIYRDGSATVCPRETYPGIFNAGKDYGYTRVLFKNSGNAPVCLTVNFDPSSGSMPCGTNGHAAVYQAPGGSSASPYNPMNQSTNYLGDVGSSTTQPFSVTIDTGYFELVFHNNSSISQCDVSFSFFTEDMSMITQSQREVQPIQVNILSQATCNPPTGGSCVLTGLPVGNWVLQQSGSGGTTSLPGSGDSYTVTGLAPGVYRFSVVNSAGCSSSETGSFQAIIVQY